MKLTYCNGPFTVEFEAATQKEMVVHLARFQAIFEEDECGLCKSKNIKFNFRKAGKSQFHEMICKDCGGQLPFHLNDNTEGTMYVTRKLPNGSYDYKNKGWTKWSGKKEESSDEEVFNSSPQKSTKKSK